MMNGHDMNRKSGPKYRYSITKYDGLVKSHFFVMPDLIRHPELTEITGFRLSPE
jgi:hypothetical protein